MREIRLSGEPPTSPSQAESRPPRNSSGVRRLNFRERKLFGRFVLEGDLLWKGTATVGG